MKNIITKGFFTLLTLLAVVSCKKDEVDLYSGPNAINLLHDNKSSFSEMTFLAFAPTVTDFTYNVNVYIQGVSKNYDRPVKLALGAENTAVLGINFLMDLDIVMPAGKTTVSVPCLIKRAGIGNIAGGILIDLKADVSSDFSGNGVNGNLKIKVSDEFPTTWLNAGFWVGYNFGRCTKAKYKFFYERKGTIDTKPWEDMMKSINLINELNNYITAWNVDPNNSQNKILDDDGSEMKFSPET